MSPRKGFQTLANCGSPLSLHSLSQWSSRKEAAEDMEKYARCPLTDGKIIWLEKYSQVPGKE